MSSGNRPIHEIKLGRIRASIWSHEGNGQGNWHSVSITRLYREREEWKTSTSFGRDDLPVVSKAVEMAYAWIWKTQERRNVDT